MTVPFDPFAPEETGYSPEKFYVASEDHRGHTKSVRTGPERSDTVTIKPFIAAAISALRDTCPQYRTNQDVIRDFIVHGLHMRAEQMKGEMPLSWHAEIGQIRAIVELDRLMNRRRQHEHLLERMEEELRSAKSAEEMYDAIIYCERAAIELELPDYIRRASDLIDRYRR